MAAFEDEEGATQYHLVLTPQVPSQDAPVQGMG